MNIRELHYLVKLSELKHFRKAAEACFVSQPALSMQIKKLEDTLGVQLLERSNKSVLLTKEGELIAARAVEILRSVDEMKTIARSIRDPFSGDLHVGIFPTLAPYWLPHMMPILSQAFPKISFYLREEKTQILIALLKEGRLDLAFLAEPVLENDFQSQTVLTEPFLLAVAESDSLSQLASVKPADLVHKNLLLLDEGHCLRDQALSFCHQINVKENQTFRATSLETLRYMVASGLGVTLMPKLACLPTKNVVYIPFESAEPMRKIAMYWRKTSGKQRLFDAILKAMVYDIKTCF
jgi:LysR family hydrogen peroxide-inducible transcriptional activator